MNITPAYGRDYKSRKAVVDDLRAKKDFMINDMSSQYDGSYVNVDDLSDKTDDYQLQVRYGKLRKVTTVRLKEVRRTAT